MNRTDDIVRSIQNKPAQGSVAHQSHMIAITHGEPLLYALAGLVRYARAYYVRYDTRVAEDNVLGPAFRAALTGLHDLLNGDGAIAMERGSTQDSKDNSACEELYQRAREEAGLSEE
jgi:hypothetical protein